MINKPWIAPKGKSVLLIRAVLNTRLPRPPLGGRNQPPPAKTLPVTNLPPNIRAVSKFAFVAVALAASSLFAPAQPSPTESNSPTASPVPGPGGMGPAITKSGPPTPMIAYMLQGILSDEEYKTYNAFQLHLNEDPAIKEINTRIAKLAKELQQLRMEANATREKLIAANPEIKAIQEKIATAMRSRASVGPVPMPASAPTKGN